MVVLKNDVSWILFRSTGTGEAQRHQQHLDVSPTFVVTLSIPLLPRNESVVSWYQPISPRVHALYAYFAIGPELLDPVTSYQSNSKALSLLLTYALASNGGDQMLRKSKIPTLLARIRTHVLHTLTVSVVPANHRGAVAFCTLNCGNFLKGESCADVSCLFLPLLFSKNYCYH